MDVAKLIGFGRADLDETGPANDNVIGDIIGDQMTANSVTGNRSHDDWKVPARVADRAGLEECESDGLDG